MADSNFDISDDILIFKQLIEALETEIHAADAANNHLNNMSFNFADKHEVLLTILMQRLNEIRKLSHDIGKRVDEILLNYINEQTHHRTAGEGR